MQSSKLYTTDDKVKWFTSENLVINEMRLNRIKID